jgi:hypothetical protein
LIAKASTIGGLLGGGKKAASSVAATSSSSMGDSDPNSMQSMMGQIEKIKNFSLTLSVCIPPKDKEKHKSKGTSGTSNIGPDSTGTDGNDEETNKDSPNQK